MGDGREKMPFSFCACLAARTKKMERRYRLRALECDFEKLVQWVAELLKIEPEGILSAGKQIHRAIARSLQCLGITQPRFCRAGRRGEEFAASENLEIIGKKNAEFHAPHFLRLWWNYCTLRSLKAVSEFFRYFFFARPFKMGIAHYSAQSLGI
jgi:hypothetical protein